SEPAWPACAYTTFAIRMRVSVQAWVLGFRSLAGCWVTHSRLPRLVTPTWTRTRFAALPNTFVGALRPALAVLNKVLLVKPSKILVTSDASEALRVSSSWHRLDPIDLFTEKADDSGIRRSYCQPGGHAWPARFF